MGGGGRGGEGLGGGKGSKRGEKGGQNAGLQKASWMHADQSQFLHAAAFHWLHTQAMRLSACNVTLYNCCDGPTSTGGTLSGARAVGAFFRGGSPPRAGRGLPPPSPTRGARPSLGT